MAREPALMLGTGLHLLDRWAAGQAYERDVTDRARVHRVHPETTDDLQQERVTGSQKWRIVASYLPRSDAN
jgi:hypothetical protein